MTNIQSPTGAGSAPTATKMALVATLVITAAAISDIARRNVLNAPEASAYLLLFSLLFLFRVAGQLLVFLRTPAWLPPMHQWHLMPYRLLLPSQVAILAFMALLEVSIFRGWSPLGTASPRAGSLLIGFSFLYAGVMAVRYAVRMYRRPEERWFGGVIPIVFHFVLAAFVFTWGKFNVTG